MQLLLQLLQLTRKRILIQTQVITPRKYLAVKTRGAHFGEIALLQSDSIRTASIMAQDHCTLASLARSDLDELLKNWPEMKVHNIYITYITSPPARSSIVNSVGNASMLLTLK